MLLQPTADALNTAGDQFKAGNYAPLNNYDDQGNYKPSVASSLIDAVPFVGPWNRNFQNEANTKGVLPALGGLATDMFAPEVAGKIVAPAVNAAGSVARFASADKASANLAATQFFVKGSPGQLLQSALKPSVTYGTGAADMLEKGLPQVLSADPNLQGVSGFARASEVAKDASAKPYDDLVAPYRSYPGGRAPRPSSINGAPVADAQLFSMPLMDQLEQPHFNVSPELRPDDNVFASKSATARPVSRVIASTVRPRMWLTITDTTSMFPSGMKSERMRTVN